MAAAALTPQSCWAGTSTRCGRSTGATRSTRQACKCCSAAVLAPTVCALLCKQGEHCKQGEARMQVPPGETLTSGVYQLLASGGLSASHPDHPAARRGAADVLPASTSGIQLQSAYLAANGRCAGCSCLSCLRLCPFPHGVSCSGLHVYTCSPAVLTLYSSLAAAGVTSSASDSASL